jgi:AcrR family transcriptional regulator
MPTRTRRRPPGALRPRKTPQQERSRRLNDDLLEAAARVLAREGAARFTTNRVAEAAGVSVGSLYQYYPNKAALLLRLHERDAETSWTTLRAILDDTGTPSRQRLAQIVYGFFQVQGAATDHHVALQEAQALISGTDEFRALEERVVARLEAFLREAGCPGRDAAFLGRFTFLVVTGIGERIGTRRLSRREIDQLAKATTDMLAGFLGLSGDGT